MATLEQRLSRMEQDLEAVLANTATVIEALRGHTEALQLLEAEQQHQRALFRDSEALWAGIRERVEVLGLTFGAVYDGLVEHRADPQAHEPGDGPSD